MIFGAQGDMLMTDATECVKFGTFEGALEMMARSLYLATTTQVKVSRWDFDQSDQVQRGVAASATLRLTNISTRLPTHAQTRIALTNADLPSK
jgi:hypothetical protein